MTLPSDLQPKDQLPKHHQKSQHQLLQSPLTQITALEQVVLTVKDVEDITKEESESESKILINLLEVPSLGSGLTCVLSYNFLKFGGREVNLYVGGASLIAPGILLTAAHVVN